MQITLSPSLWHLSPSGWWEGAAKRLPLEWGWEIIYHRQRPAIMDMMKWWSGGWGWVCHPSHPLRAHFLSHSLWSLSDLHPTLWTVNSMGLIMGVLMSTLMRGWRSESRTSRCPRSLENREDISILCASLKGDISGRKIGGPRRERYENLKVRMTNGNDDELTSYSEMDDGYHHILNIGEHFEWAWNMLNFAAFRAKLTPLYWLVVIIMMTTEEEHTSLREEYSDDNRHNGNRWWWSAAISFLFPRDACILPPDEIAG